MICSIKIECGEFTCASEPGRFCRFVRVSHFGKVYQCAAFADKNGDMIRLKEGDGVSVLKGGVGWLMRCQECIEEAKSCSK